MDSLRGMKKVIVRLSAASTLICTFIYPGWGEEREGEQLAKHNVSQQARPTLRASDRDSWFPRQSEPSSSPPPPPAMPLLCPLPPSRCSTHHRRAAAPPITAEPLLLFASSCYSASARKRAPCRRGRSGEGDGGRCHGTQAFGLRGGRGASHESGSPTTARRRPRLRRSTHHPLLPTTTNQAGAMGPPPPPRRGEVKVYFLWHKF
jgi:hypothetical protein